MVITCLSCKDWTVATTHGGLDNVFSASISPLDVGRVTLLEDGDGVPVDNELSTFGMNISLELSVRGVILEHVDLGNERDVSAGSQRK